MPVVRLKQSQQEFEAEPDEVILDAAERAGIGMVHSCRSGTCRACITKVLSGCVEHDPDYVLELNIDAYELDDGYRLLCSAFARTDCELEK
ncbi:MAG: 2Fe-2S iron-sulfur cluster binding domain-containing protein [Chloroflexi bacterium]|nr:2Fe-2S iron-sulfur cluster binding domain-containing protein [Chloroflexota bacterium]